MAPRLQRIFLFICHISILGQEGSFPLLLLFWHHSGLHHDLCLLLNEGGNGLDFVWEVVGGKWGTTRLYERKHASKPPVHPGSAWATGAAAADSESPGVQSRCLRDQLRKGKERPCRPGFRSHIHLQSEQPCFYFYYILKFCCFKGKKIRSWKVLN